MSTAGSVPAALPYTAAAAAAAVFGGLALLSLPATLVAPPSTPDTDLRAPEDDIFGDAVPAGEAATPECWGLGLGPGAAEATVPMMALSELEVARCCCAAVLVVSGDISPPARASCSCGVPGPTAAPALLMVSSVVSSLTASPVAPSLLLSVLDTTSAEDKALVAAAVAASAAGPLPPCNERFIYAKKLATRWRALAWPSASIVRHAYNVVLDSRHQ